MSIDKLSLEGLDFQATKINIKNNILTITLNRPEKKNALNNVMVNELNYALAYAKQEREIRVVVIDAEGDIFCAGADLRRAKEESNVPKLEGADDISFSSFATLAVARRTILTSPTGILRKNMGRQVRERPVAAASTILRWRRWPKSTWISLSGRRLPTKTFPLRHYSRC